MTPHNLSLITTFLLVFATAIGGGTIARVLKQPTILGYIAAGVLIGNLASGIIDHVTLQGIAEIGVTLLLFTLGVEFSFFRLRKVLRSVLFPAILQVLVSFIVFLVLSMGLGIGILPSLFMAAAFSLSSTAVVVKILSERGELETVPGEVATGWLVVQDIAVIPIMILLPTIVAVVQKPDTSVVSAVLSILLGILVAGLTIGIVLLLGKQGIPRLLKAAAAVGSREILLLTTVAVVFLSAVVFYATGLSAALGAFIAGLIIAETSQNHAIFAEIRPLRDLFAVVFFVTLGMTVPLSVVAVFFPTILILLMAVVFIKWVVVYGLLRFMGYHQKTAFLVGLSLTQVSEFGFVIAGVGTGLGALSGDQYAILVAVTFGALLVSTPILASGHGVYYWFARNVGRVIPKLFTQRDEAATSHGEQYPMEGHIVICGYGRVGSYIGRALTLANIPFIAIDYNLHTVEKAKKESINIIYGDPSEIDVLDYAECDQASMLILSLPDSFSQELIIFNAKKLNPKLVILSRVHKDADRHSRRDLGAEIIMQPEFEASLSIIRRVLLWKGLDREEIARKIKRLKIEHGMI